jgi:hypothetical protein
MTGPTHIQRDVSSCVGVGALPRHDKGSPMADRNNEKDGQEEKVESEDQDRTGEEQAAINRENDPPA